MKQIILGSFHKTSPNCTKSHSQEKNNVSLDAITIYMSPEELPTLGSFHFRFQGNGNVSIVQKKWIWYFSKPPSV
jgi:hypothetical protein